MSLKLFPNKIMKTTRVQFVSGKMCCNTCAHI